MKISIIAAAVVAFLLLLPAPVPASRDMARPHPPRSHVHQPTKPRVPVDEEMAKPELFWRKKQTGGPRSPDTVQVAGSRLPNCSHACESCSPCRLVMVSFVCSTLAEAETCPVSYKCMCNSKAYPVP